MKKLQDLKQGDRFLLNNLLCEVGRQNGAGVEVYFGLPPAEGEFHFTPDRATLPDYLEVELIGHRDSEETPPWVWAPVAEYNTLKNGTPTRKVTYNTDPQWAGSNDDIPMTPAGKYETRVHGEPTPPVDFAGVVDSVEVTDREKEAIQKIGRSPRTPLNPLTPEELATFEEEYLQRPIINGPIQCADPDYTATQQYAAEMGILEHQRIASWIADHQEREDARVEFNWLLHTRTKSNKTDNNE